MTLSATFAPAACTAPMDVNNVDYHHPGACACAGLGPNAGAGTASGSVIRPSRTNSNSKQRQLGVHVQHFNATSSSSSPPQFSHASSYIDSNLPQQQMQQSHLSSAVLSHHSQYHSPSPSLTQNNNSTPSSSSGASATATRPRMTRNNSHLSRTGPGALVIPIPPTLANSPHLQSPNSIFRRPHAGPRASPDVEEERWLRDTVPMGSAAPPSPPPSAGPPATGSGMGYTCSTAAAAAASAAGGGTLGEQGRGRSASTSSRNTTSPSISPAFSLLPSSLPRHGVYAHGQALSPRERG